MQDKVIFFSGDEVRVKQNIPNKPIMVVKEPKKMTIRNGENKKVLRGIECWWFDSNMSYQEAIFSSKDLEKIKSYAETTFRNHEGED